jgi:hypothetical protein
MIRDSTSMKEAWDYLKEQLEEKKPTPTSNFSNFSSTLA